MEQSRYQTKKGELEELHPKILSEFNRTLEGINNPVLLILQSHLYFENLLERYITAELPNGETLIKKGNLTFYQKVMVADSFGVIDRQVIDGLKKYNSLRNDLAHKFGHTITKAQVTELGRTIGGHYAQIEESAEGCLAREIEFITADLAGCLGLITHVSEEFEKAKS